MIETAKRTLTLLALLMSGVAASAQSPATVRHRQPRGDALWGIASGPTGFVAVGTNGAILQSNDGQTWVRRESGTTDWLTAVAYGVGRFIAVGDRGRILSSVDGTTWSNVPHAATTRRLNNVARTGSYFFAVGEGGTILRSVDGIAWTAQPSPTNKWLRGLLPPLITGEGGTLLIAESVDGGWMNYVGFAQADLESITFISSLHTASFENGTTNAIYAAAGSGGEITFIRFTFNDRGGRTLVTTSTTSVGVPSRLRCILSGPTHRSSVFNQFGGGDDRVIAAPTMAFADDGAVFSSYEGPEWTQPLATPGSWRREEPELAAGIHAGLYYAPHASFYLVGDDEVILQRAELFDGRLGNISSRGAVESGDRALIAGFVVSGPAAKAVLVRGVGPALANFGIRNALARPTLTVYDAASRVVATNSAWSRGLEAAAIEQAAPRVGAFPLATGSNDAAVLLSLAPGAYTAEIAATQPASGVALIEAYDLDDRVSGTARAINLSTRGFVGPGENVLVAGLQVQGPVWRTLLIRAVGPTLSNFGVTDALADPVLTLAATGGPTVLRGVILDRDPGRVDRATRAAGTFALPRGTQDDALVITLLPGSYTLTVSSKTNATGVALLEIYDVGVDSP